MTKAITVTRTDEEKERDLPVIGNLYARGWNMHQIAGFLSDNLYAGRGAITIRTVSADIERIRDLWTQSALIDFNEARGREIAKLDALETAYWVAWEESRKDMEEATETETKDEVPLRSGEVVPVSRSHKGRKKTNREGNPLYLNGVERCIEKRCKILGLFEAQSFSMDWRSAAQNLGVNPTDAEQIKETTVRIMMQAITRQTGGADASPADIIEGQFTSEQ